MASWPPAPAHGTFAVLHETLGHLGPTPQLDFAELFAGAGSVHRHMKELGYQGRAMDREYCEDHDILTPLGFVVAARIAASIRPGGVLWLAPPCSSWVWLTRGSSGRHLGAMGDITQPGIVAQNALVERCMLLCELVHRQGAHYIIEQPASSVLWDYPAVHACLKRHGLQGPCVLDMGAYGGSSVKPTHLWGTAPYLQDLARRCNAADRARLEAEGVKTTRRWTDADGRKCCQGTGDLKGTQAYPEGWGVAHAHAFAEHYGLPSGSLDHVAATDQQEALARLLRDQPELRDAWFLRDFLGEPWH